MSDILNHSALEAAIKTLVAEKLSSAAMMEQISAALDKAVASAINDALRPYSATGKVISQAIEQSLQVDADLGIPAYNETVKRIVRAKVDEHVNSSGRDMLQAELDEMFDTAPAELKLSELIKKFKETDLYKDDWENGEISLHVEQSSGGYRFIYWDEACDTPKHRCTYNLHIDKEGKVFSGKLGYGTDVKKATPLFFGAKHGFSKYLLNLWACGTRLIVDEDDCDLHYGQGD
jgi:hypothetical protein